MMTLEQAIQHWKEVAEEYEAHGIEAECYKCAKEHRQLAKWLEDYKQLKEATRWIPCSEKLPDSEERCLVFTKGHNVCISRMMGRNLRGEWTCCGYEVTNWMPFPEMPKGDAE